MRGANRRGRGRAIASSVPAGVPASIAWTQVTPTNTGTYGPTWVGYTRAAWDPLSGQTLWYLGRASNPIIYGTDHFAYKSSTREWTWLGGTGTFNNPGGDGSTAVDYTGASISPWISDRHPVEQMAVDTVRGAMYISRGVAGGISPTDLWKYTLNADPRSNRYASVTISTVPSVDVTGSMIYNPDDDLLFLHGNNSGGFPKSYIFALGSGAVSAAQAAAGASVRQDWTLVYSPGTVDPPLSNFSSLVYLPTTHTALHFGHTGSANEVWEYNFQAKTWTNLSPAGAPTEPGTYGAPERLVAYIGSGLMLYHQTTHTTSAGSAADKVYNRGTNTWSSLSSSGTGPQVLSTVEWDPTLGSLGGVVAWAHTGVMWHGVLS